MGRDDLLGAFEEMVLLAVARGGGAAYGMTVRREIEHRTGRDVTIGSVYATLDRMESKGWITSEWGETSEGRSGRAKRLFEIQPDGVRMLERASRMRAGLWEGIDLDRLAAEAEAGS